MPTVARVTCPRCGAQFQTAVEQILDVRVDPTATERLLGGLVNVARCPRCGFAAPLDLPLLYHDPNKEAALLYLPLSAGKTEAERQQAAGRLTRRLMDSLPKEERKGYLFQPETFVTMESFIKRIYELEGVGPEVLERRQARSRLLQALLEAEPAQWESLLEEQADLVDKPLFTTLLALEEQIRELQAQGGEIAEDELRRLKQLVDFFAERYPDFRRLQEASRAVAELLREPTYARLVEAFVAQPDEEDIDRLVALTFDQLDYHFFNEFVRRIEEAPSEEEAERLREVRRRVLAARDRVVEAQRKAVEERLALIDKLLRTEEVEKMLRSHLGLIDDLFLQTINGLIATAEEENDRALADRLRSLLDQAVKLITRLLPPEVLLARQVLAAQDRTEVARLLDERPQIAAAVAGLLEEIAAAAEQMGDKTGADRARLRLADVRAWLAAHGEGGAAPSPSASASQAADDEAASRGFIISTKK